MSDSASTSHSYKIVMLPPPGNIIVPNGFPADPRPSGAPKVFLDAMDIRIRVFVEEQGCDLGPELDEDDPRSYHWVLYGPKSDNEKEMEPLSVIRIVPFPHGPHPNGFDDPNEEPYVKLGRVATMAHARGKGLSKLLTKDAFGYLSKHGQNDLSQEWNGMILTHAQVDVEKMYSRMGFVTDERLGNWEEVGINHIGMWKRIKVER